MGRHRRSVQEWLSALGRVGMELRRVGRQWAGPCPRCGEGDDRFHIQDRGDGTALVDCRICGGQGAAGRRAYGEIVEMLWPEDGPKAPATSGRQGKAETLGLGSTVATTPEMARALWRLAVETCPDISPTPAMAYLVERRAWPPASLGYELPPTVAWLPRPDWPAQWHHYKPPAQAAGAVLFVLTDASENIQGVQLEALTAQGRRLPRRWRRTYGPAKGGLFWVPNSSPVEIRLVEGPVTALACAWLWPDCLPLATAGTAGLKGLDAARLKDLGLAVVVVGDADDQGQEASKAAWAALDGAGVAVSLARPPGPGDAADWLAGAIAAQGSGLLDQWETYFTKGM